MNIILRIAKIKILILYCFVLLCAAGARAEQSIFGSSLDCSFYFLCENDDCKQFQCAENTIFNNSTLKCEAGDKSSCELFFTARSQPKFSCDETFFGVKSHPEVCWKFFDCYMGKATEETCMTGYIFYEPLTVCLPGNRKTCLLWGQEETTVSAPIGTVVPTTPPPSEFYCEKGFFGIFPSPTNCWSYVDCYLGKATIKECLPGYIFYAPLLSCLPGIRQKCSLYT